MSYATRNENGDNMGNTFVRCPIENKKQYAENWNRIFGTHSDKKVKVWDESDERVLDACLGTKPGPQASIKRRDGSIVTTFEREDDNGLISGGQGVGKPHAVPCACYACRSSAIGDY